MDKREAFEKWIKRVRVQPNMTKKRSGEYMDMDTDWLWSAFAAGVAFASDAARAGAADALA